MNYSSSQLFFFKASRKCKIMLLNVFHLLSCRLGLCMLSTVIQFFSFFQNVSLIICLYFKFFFDSDDHYFLDCVDRLTLSERSQDNITHDGQIMLRLMCSQGTKSVMRHYPYIAGKQMRLYVHVIILLWKRFCLESCQR